MTLKCPHCPWRLAGLPDASAGEDSLELHIEKTHAAEAGL